MDKVFIIIEYSLFIAFLGFCIIKIITEKNDKKN
jgi:hypothetical protein